MNLLQQKKCRQDERGQVLPLFALLVLVIILFVGFGIDLGFAYVSKANLSKAVDAACLTGMRNLSQGQSQAAAIARSAFNLNYGLSGRDSRPPTITINFSTDANNNTLLNVNATATIKTFFIRILPMWKTMNVGANAQAHSRQAGDVGGIGSIGLDERKRWSGSTATRSFYFHRFLRRHQ
jgi:Flp pilus assembly protein TadG